MLDLKDFMTVRQYSDFSGIKVQAIQQGIYRGNIKAVKVGNKYYIPKDFKPERKINRARSSYVKF